MTDNRTAVDVIQEVSEKVCDDICKWMHKTCFREMTEDELHEKCAECPLRRLL